MLTLTASTVGSLPLVAPVRLRVGCKDRINQTGCTPVYVSLQFQACIQTGFKKLSLTAPIGLGKQLRPIYGSKYSNRKLSDSITCFAAVNARCSASGQTQTITREAPTITKAPVREPTKTPKLDDGGPGFPPGGDDGGGGGGGGGGGNWSGGFFFFGFLAFLGFLKDKESEEEYRDGSRRR
ncbi:protein YELLOW LEAF 1, choloroplastic [Ricinus communis]|uniref:protein YELLOW LEAF 1, choloroplastic n=1 Tax=Ricinus communis TaxID=3988 RepID=UPI0007722E6D|nr:protein YELLOW LEAF 1, choloroplastic [Ricinus communis]XP_015583645.1 protein YELLOW LEAF 1, choloroplastic [Ricinus communis]|eukprot:XP_015583638.1 WAS/WASL-interacting protein family member 1 [Ricinus communis]